MSQQSYKLISKEEWFKRMRQWQKTLRDILQQYHQLKPHVKGSKACLVNQVIEELEEAIKYNTYLMLRGEVEESYTLYLLDENNTPVIQRVTREERKRAYALLKKRRPSLVA